MSDILWSDPSPFPGRGPSKRGVGQTFGPDVTERFLTQNNLSLVIRSHEVRVCVCGGGERGGTGVPSLCLTMCT